MDKKPYVRRAYPSKEVRENRKKREKFNRVKSTVAEYTKIFGFMAGLVYGGFFGFQALDNWFNGTSTTTSINSISYSRSESEIVPVKQKNVIDESLKIYKSNPYQEVLSASDVSKLVHIISIDSLLPSNKEYIHYFEQLSYSQAIAHVKTPSEANRYCTTFLSHGGRDADKKLHGKTDYWASFNKTHKLRSGDCDDGAIAAAALLSDDGYEPCVLLMNGEGYSHLVFVYRGQNGKLGSVGMSKTDYQQPIHDSLDDLMLSVGKAANIPYKKHYLYNIKDRHPGFVDNNQNNTML